MSTLREIYLAGGCFWGVERFFQKLYGVTDTKVGYANGMTDNPSYEDVCSKNTGHAETVKVTYDPAIFSLLFLLDLYYLTINPTLLNRQGNDVGVQYRTGIYYTDSQDRPIIDFSLQHLQARYDKPMMIEVEPLRHFYPAEEYHQEYLHKNLNGYCHIQPGLLVRAKGFIIDPYRYKLPEKKALQMDLTEEQYAVTQQNATEPPFKSPLWQQFEKGIYVDITTGEPLFSSADKFSCSCGWPSFSKPIDPNVLIEKTDLSCGMARTEVRSRVGDAHLGHVFSDGPLDLGGLRYCINGAALKFIAKNQMEDEGYAYLNSFLSMNL